MSIELNPDDYDTDPKHLAEIPTETPNVVLSNPDTRRKLGGALYVIAVVVGIVSYFLAGVELPIDLDFWSSRVLGAISILSGAFGLGVTLPNIPKS